MPAIDGHTKLIGFWGSTYQTSKMYAVYNAALTALGLNFVYVPFVVNDLAQAVAGLRHLGIAAVGVTIPYKMAVMPYLDELDAAAQRIGAVNVIVNHAGRLVGGNTDGVGAVRALAETGPIQGQKVVLLGAGGAARAIAFALREAGCTLTLLNRTAAKAQALAEATGSVAESFTALEPVVAEADILINATSVGMAQTPEAAETLVPAHLLRPTLRVMEIVSHPRETPLVRAAQAQGCPVILGHRMLLWQSIYKFKTYTGVEPPVAVMEQAMALAQ